jgi:hypothetical protein
MPGGGTTATKSENKDPWAPAQPYLTNIMQQAANTYHSGAGGGTWQGPLIGNLDPSTQQGMNLTNQTAGQNAGTAGQPYNYAQGMIQNNGLTSGYDQPLGIYGNVNQSASNPTSAATNLGGMASGATAGQNPALMTMLQDNADRIGNRVASQMSGAGRYGSFGHGDAMARSITAANAPIISGAYENDQNRMLSANSQIDSSQRSAEASRMGAAAGQTGILNSGMSNAQNWAGMLPTLNSLQYDPANRMMMTGGINDARNQQLLDAQRQLFEQQNAMPWTQLQRYAGIVNPTNPQNAGTTTGTATQEQQTPWTQYAGLGIAGLGLLSDRTEKTDIKKIGKDENTGLPLYSYRYKDDPKTYPKIVGPMAQDVEKAFPGSTEKVGGKLYIKNAALGIAGL